METRDRTQVVRLDIKCLYPLGHFTGSRNCKYLILLMRQDKPYAKLCDRSEEGKMWLALESGGKTDILLSCLWCQALSEEFKRPKSSEVFVLPNQSLMSLGIVFFFFLNSLGAHYPVPK